MDHIVATLTSFPPTGEAMSSDRRYDLAVKGYLVALHKLAETAPATILANPAQVFEVIDPAINSIGYLAILDIFHGAPDSKERVMPQEELLNKTLNFLLKFDAYQVRYVGPSLLGLLERVASGTLFSPLVSVELLTTAMLRLDPSGSLFTSTHLLLAKLAFDTNITEPALAVIDRDVVFYPDMAGHSDPRPLCTKELEPSAYISSATALTGPLKNASVLEYNLVCGLIYISRRDWSKALAALERTITHPSKDKGVSKIMTEAYKKWLLVGLLQNGELPMLPSYTPTWPKSAYSTLSPEYISLATLFNTTDAPRLKAEVEASGQLWEDDGNASLVAEVVGAYQKWQIINLQKIYQNVPLSTIRTTTLSAVTGEALQDDQAAADLVRSMIEAGMLKGVFHAGANGAGSYLNFQQDNASLTEVEFARELARSHHSISALGKQYQLTNERLSGSKEYARHLIREQKRGERKDEAGGPFESQIDEEDLMQGIMTSA